MPPRTRRRRSVGNPNKLAIGHKMHPSKKESKIKKESHHGNMGPNSNLQHAAALFYPREHQISSRSVGNEQSGNFR